MPQILLSITDITDYMILLFYIIIIIIYNYSEIDFFFISSIISLTIGSDISVRSSRYEARGKFGEHERCVRVARGVAESNSSFLRTADA